MEQHEIEKIIADIKTQKDLDAGVETFHRLPKEDRMELLGFLKNTRDEAAGRYLNAIYQDEKDKDVQKQIRKLLFALKTLGIVVDQPKSTGESVLKKGEETPKGHRALISNYDYEGVRLVMAAYELKRNTFLFASAAVHFSDGLLELLSGPISRNELASLIKEYLGQNKAGAVIVEISPAYANYLLEEASVRSGKYKEEVRQFKKLTAAVKADVERPEDIYSLPTPEEIPPLPLEKVLEHPVFENFAFTWKTMEEDKKTYNDAAGGGSSIVLPPYMAEERRQAFIGSLPDKEELKSKIPSIKRLLEDYACIFHRLGEFAHYKGLIKLLPEETTLNKTLEHFIKKFLEEREEKEEAIIIDPYG